VKPGTAAASTASAIFRPKRKYRAPGTGRFRDDLASLLEQGTTTAAWLMAERTERSPDLYGRPPQAAVGRAYHLQSPPRRLPLGPIWSAYNGKHNLANARTTATATTTTNSWNHGWKALQRSRHTALRNRQQRISWPRLLARPRGVPMLLMGDEVAPAARGATTTLVPRTIPRWMHWAARCRRSGPASVSCKGCWCCAAKLARPASTRCSPTCKASRGRHQQPSDNPLARSGTVGVEVERPDWGRWSLHPGLEPTQRRRGALLWCRPERLQQGDPLRFCPKPSEGWFLA